MTHREAIIQAFRLNDYRITLGYALRHPWGYELRVRLTELRREGWTIQCVKGKTASDNMYIAAPPDGNQMRLAI